MLKLRLRLEKYVSLLALTTVIGTYSCFGQDKHVQGIVLEKMNMLRLGSVRLKNISQNLVTFSDEKGLFSIRANPGDKIAASLDNYIPDTLRVDSTVLIFSMIRNPFVLRDVNITATSRSPSDVYNSNVRQFSSIYGRRPPNIMSMVPRGNNIGVDFITLAALFGKKTKQLDRLQETIERDYREMIIDSVFNIGLVKRLTNLEGPTLQAFMIHFRPPFEYIRDVTEYDLYTYIRNNYKEYAEHPDWYDLEKIPRISMAGDSLVISSKEIPEPGGKNK